MATYRQRPIGRDEAADIAVSALTFVADDTVLLDRFLKVTGIEPASLRQAAAAAGFLPAVLDFILAHEPTLAAMSRETSIAPARVAEARRVLAGPFDDETS